MFADLSVICLGFILLIFPVQSKNEKLKDNFVRKEKDKVYPIEGINSELEEFAPYWVDSLLIFCSDRDQGWTATLKPESGMLFSTLSGNDSITFFPPQSFLPDLHTAINHGPVCFNLTRDTAYYTVADMKPFQKSKKLNTLGLRIAVKEDNKWKVAGEFIHNSDNYNIAHPFLTPDGKMLFFASDMEGGMGGMDIWKCTRENGKWGKPENLGELINTPQTEVNPFFYKGVLYFSSNGHEGLGGADIYASTLNETWTSPQNMGKPLNSPYDDFGLSLVKTGFGYFTSNRPGGMGGNDIYAWESGNQKASFAQISGRLFLNGEPAPDIKMALLDNRDLILQYATTDSTGKYVFYDVDGNSTYTVKMLLGSEQTKTGYLLEMHNDQEQVVKRIAQNENGDFVYELLTPDDHDNLVMLDMDDNSFLKLPLTGQVYHLETGDVGEGITVYLMDEDKNVTHQVMTMEGGMFSFKGVPPRDNYLLRVNEGNTDLKIIIFNAKGEVVTTLVRGPGGDFVYERLAYDDDYITIMNEDDVMMKIKLDDNFVVSNIYYALDQWEFLPESAEELDKLVNIMKNNPHIKLELEAHTDSQGKAEYNLELSEKRAKNTAQYIILQGLDPDRIIAKGYGESMPLNHCVDGVPCSDEEYAVNRRTEFRFKKKE